MPRPARKQPKRSAAPLTRTPIDAPETAGNTWAPEAYYSVIDSTVIKDKGTYYRFTNDERDPISSSPCSKFITAEKSRNLTGTSYDFVSDCIGSGSIQRGERPTVFRSNTEKKWYLFIDEYGGPCPRTTHCPPAPATARLCR